MQQTFEIEYGKPYPLGAHVEGNRVMLSFEVKERENCGIILYHEPTKTEERIPLPDTFFVGNIASVCLKNLKFQEYSYNFYENGVAFVDPYAQKIVGNEKWHPYKDGYTQQKRIGLRAGFVKDTFSWKKDCKIGRSYGETILYCLHVRGFTKDASSRVRAKGTYRGIVEKIPYLKELGVNCVELMPAYEFIEDSVVGKENGVMPYDCGFENGREVAKEQAVKEQAVKEQVVKEQVVKEQAAKEQVVKEQVAKEQIAKEQAEMSSTEFNYWGYQEGFYFAPKQSYAFSSDAVREFKEMVQSLHEAGIECIMQFYFPVTYKAQNLLNVLHFWVYHYHIDGFRLKGADIPLYLLAQDAMLSTTKMMYDDVPENILYPGNQRPKQKNIAYCNDNFSNLYRMYLKGDNNCLEAFVSMNRTIPEKIGVIHSITNYYGFRLNDLVSYERKHNEKNGEKNRDGVQNNYSWNCGEEGPSKRKNVNQLRLKQVKNALALLFLSQGTVFFMSGDEFLQTQEGNNNPYNQDNSISWLNWKLSARQKKVLDFCKKLIAFRKENEFLQKDFTLKLVDCDRCGFPQLSYHGEELWKADLQEYNHHIAMLYVNKKACDKEPVPSGKEQELSEDEAKSPNAENQDNDRNSLSENESQMAKPEEYERAFTYVCYNMHWNDHVFAVPEIAEAKEWKIAIYTETESELKKQQVYMKEAQEGGRKLKEITLPQRSIMVLTTTAPLLDTECKIQNF